MMTKSFKPITALYREMDSAWDLIAQQYDFRCSGCTDNCCQSLFFHHTFIEKAYFLAGFNALDPELKKNILHRATIYCNKTFQKESQIESLKIMCPANEKGLCLLYEHRPMICRLHGLPHELSRSGGPPMRGAGCDAGEFDTMPYTPFDRTPYYREMARLEMDYRKIFNLRGKIKQTIAQMLLDNFTETEENHGRT